MRRQVAWILAITLALGWCAGAVRAQSTGQTLPSWVTAQGEKAPMTEAPVVIDSVDEGNGRGLRFFAGQAMYFLTPAFETNPAYGRSLTSGGVSRVDQVNFAYDLNEGYQAWFGLVNGNGLGARVRWFSFADSQDAFITNPGDGSSIFSARPLGVTPLSSLVTGDKWGFFSEFNVVNWDFEVIQEFQPSDVWELVGAAGFRYSHLHQDYNVAFTNITGATTGTIVSGHNFNGFGPTVALESKRFLGGSGLALFANGRGSLLFGSSEQVAFRSFATTVPQAFTHDQSVDVIPVGELEAGTEFRRAIGRILPFVQIGFVGQVYWGGGNAANTEGIFTGGADNSSNFGLVGFFLRAGIEL